jgi:hypothetical protein
MPFHESVKGRDRRKERFIIVRGLRVRQIIDNIGWRPYVAIRGLQSRRPARERTYLGLQRGL